MGILFFCLGLLAIAILAHLIISKIKIPLPKNSVVAILFIFSIVLFIGLFSAYFLGRKYAFLPQGLWGILHVIIFYVPVMLSYVITYVALEDDSPTMTIAGFIEQANESGRSFKQIRQIISDEALILPRIDTMVKDGWIENREDKYYITEKGQTYNRFFAFGLKLLNITREG